MRIILDHDKCQGQGRCYAVATELFDSDDEGYSVLLIGEDGDSGEVPEGLEGQARLAADNCPEFAITVEE